MEKNELQVLLDQPIPRSVVSTREAGRGEKLDYLQGWYVIDRLNKIFGSLGWGKSVEIIEKEKEKTLDKYGNDMYVYTVVVKVTLELYSENSRYSYVQKEDIGSCQGISKKSFGDALEMAYKGAVTDTLKRCAKDLGMSMGLALYSKEQEFVVDDEEQVQAAKPQTEKAIEPISITDKQKSVAYLRKATVRCKSVTTGEAIDVKAVVAHLKKEFNFTGSLDTLDAETLKRIIILLNTSYNVGSVYESELK